MSHTKTPWFLDGNMILGSEVVHTNGRERNSIGISSASYSECVCEVQGSLELPHPQANAAFIVRACNSHEALVGALNTALTELRAIQARDGAPQHIAWDRGRPLQTDSCTHEWWSTVVERCEAALALAEAKP